MTIKYPNGTPFHNFKNKKNAKYKHISPIKNKSKKEIIYGDRGMTFEQEINQSNEYYLTNHKAVIHKKPTPIRIVKVDYPKRSAATIKEAYFQQASTTDYNGVFENYYIDFDAKETQNLTSFPLSNFHKHQIKHMELCEEQGGICFTLIKFVKTKQVFLLPANTLIKLWNNQNNGGRKSIKKKDLISQSYSIPYRIQPLIPYLDAVRKLINSH